MAARGRHDCSFTTTKLLLLTLLKEMPKSESIHVIRRHRICLPARSCSGRVTCHHIIHSFYYICRAALCHSSFEGHGFFKLKDYVTA